MRFAVKARHVAALPALYPCLTVALGFMGLEGRDAVCVRAGAQVRACVDGWVEVRIVWCLMPGVWCVWGT